jgi:hypothetical protein
VLIADYGLGRAPGLGARFARHAAMALERLAGHGGGVRSLRAAGGLAGLAPSAGMLVEAESGAAGGAIAVTLLRPVGRPSR